MSILAARRHCNVRRDGVDRGQTSDQASCISGLRSTVGRSDQCAEKKDCRSMTKTVLAIGASSGYLARQRGRPEGSSLASRAPVAQLDRAPDYESGGQRFESFRAHHFFASLALACSAVRFANSLSKKFLNLLMSLSSDDPLGKIISIGMREWVRRLESMPIRYKCALGAGRVEVVCRDTLLAI